MTFLCAPLDLVRGPRMLAALLAGLCALILLPSPARGSAAESSPKKSFDIPAGDAAVALKQFSAQSGAQVIFPEDAIEGTQTKSLKGAFTPAEALDRLLSGTNLKAAHDRQSGSFAVSRISLPRKEASHPNG